MRYRCESFRVCWTTILLSFLKNSDLYICHLLWFLWIFKCTKSNVWTMHVFPNSVTNMFNSPILGPHVYAYKSFIGFLCCWSCLLLQNMHMYACITRSTWTWINNTTKSILTHRNALCSICSWCNNQYPHAYCATTLHCYYTLVHSARVG